LKENEKYVVKETTFINNALAHNKQLIEQVHGAVTLGFVRRRCPVQTSAMILPITTQVFFMVFLSPSRQM